MAASKTGRTPESEMAIVALRIAASRPGGEATTTRLKEEIPDYIELTPGDLKQSATRPNEKMYHQIVGNIVSHQESEGNIIYEGYAQVTQPFGFSLVADQQLGGLMLWVVGDMMSILVAAIVMVMWYEKEEGGARVYGPA